MVPTELSGLEPRALWSAFLEICSIPHASQKEAALARALLQRARASGLAAGLDEAGNLIVRKPASPGLEGAPGLILQAHLDMVAQAEAGRPVDFDREPIRPRLDPAHPGWLSASGTSLGADNGIGVAAGLALLEEPGLRHGPLELLLTVNEEAGMSGARGLKEGSLQGRLLLNLDGEEEEEIGVGCSGGLRLGARFTARPSAPPSDSLWLRAELSGLLGGHSAQDIDKGRGNAAIDLAAILMAGLPAAPGLRLATISGGQVANAIPREASALLALPARELPAFEAALREAAEARGRALREAEPGLRFELAPASAADSALGAEDSARILAALALAPNGLRSLSEEFPGLPTLSSNLGALNWLPGPGRVIVEALILVRGARNEEKEERGAEIRRHFEAAGAEVERIASYPAWTPLLSSPLLARAREVYAGVYGRPALVKATHGGLECGLFRAAYPEWDMLSIGPNIRFPHSPSERVELASVGRFWAFLRALVERLAEPLPPPAA